MGVFIFHFMFWLDGFAKEDKAHSSTLRPVPARILAKEESVEETEREH